MRTITLLLLFFCSLHFSNAQPGKLDSSFGTNGIITNDSALYFATAIQRDGKILMAGTSGNDFAIARYNIDGSLDSSFSQDGFQTTHFTSGTASASSIAIQNDGKIVVAGSASINGGQYDFALVRYNVNGSLDKTFSGDGKQSYNIGAAYTFARAVAIQSDGKIVAAGYSYSSTISNADFTVARFNTDGSPDKTFSGDGKQVTDFGNRNNDYIFAMAIQPDGKIVAAGYTGDNINSGAHNNFALARYNTNGSPDTTFSEDGKQTTDFGFSANGYALALQSDGKIVAAGQVLNQSYDFALVRYNTDGSPDNTFSDDGKQTTGFGGEARANSITIESDGKIIAAGDFKKRDITFTDFALARYNTDGNLDNTFSDNGREITRSIAKYDEIAAITIANNKLYAAGYGRNDEFLSNMGIAARYLLDAGNNIPPTINLIGPVNNATYLAYGNVYLAAAALDADGTISKIEFYNGNTLLYTATYTPYTFKWPGVKKGNYTLTAKATDNSGLVTISAPVHISVVPNKPPTVSIINPANNQVFLKGGTVHLQAAAADPDGRIARVEFYNGTTLLTTEHILPYTFDWKIGKAGNYTLTAKAVDNWNAVTTSAAINISVVPNKAPGISIINPANGQNFTAPATINFEAAAQDPDGKIGHVRFYNGATLLTIENKVPYTYQWQNVPAGTYTITAVARDNWTEETTSAPITITVASPRAAPVDSRPFSAALKNNLAAGVSIELAPNPAGNILKINTTGLEKNKQSTISVISASGVTMKTIRSRSSAQHIQLDVSSLSRGMYLIKIISGDKVMYKQFIKM